MVGENERPYRRRKERKSVPRRVAPISVFGPRMTGETAEASEPARRRLGAEELELDDDAEDDADRTAEEEDEVEFEEEDEEEEEDAGSEEEDAGSDEEAADAAARVE